MQDQDNQQETSNSSVPELFKSDGPPPHTDPIVSPRPKRRWMWIVLAALLLVLMAGAGYYWYSNRNKDAANATTNSSKTQTTSVNAVLLDKPKKLDTDLKFFKNPEEYFGKECVEGETICTKPMVRSEDIAYYQLGVTSKDLPIIVAYVPVSPVDPSDYLAIQTKPGEYQLLGLHSPYSSLAADSLAEAFSTFKDALSDNATLDTTTVLPELSFPSSVVVKGITLESSFHGEFATGTGYLLPNGLEDIRGSFASPDSPAPKLTKLGTVAGKTAYQEVIAMPADLANPVYNRVNIYVAINELYAMRYDPKDSLRPQEGSTEADWPKMTWSSGEQTGATYLSTPQGCAIVSYITANGLTKSQLQAIGTGPNKQILYELPSASGLFNELYTTDYNKGEIIADASLKNLSVDQFQAKHAVFLAENALGELVIYLRSDMFMSGGCGKPVIYLYPSAPTSVSVSVGADVIKSEPLYLAGGWRNVLATPSGQLTYQGQTYDSLYWEGFGYGFYPAITTGTVVAHDKVVQTIRAQLTQQGFNTQEISDFLDYWQPKLPTAPYTRLTWLTTAQMDALAPLFITPQPTTIIRTFLDFQGLKEPVSLKPQTFTTPERKGFTVTEWGGLLRDGSITR